MASAKEQIKKRIEQRKTWKKSIREIAEELRDTGFGLEDVREAFKELGYATSVDRPWWLFRQVPYLVIKEITLPPSPERMNIEDIFGDFNEVFEKALCDPQSKTVHPPDHKAWKLPKLQLPTVKVTVVHWWLGKP